MVQEHLRREIITGNLEPGSRLNEIELSERFGVSRPPLREAFRKLESEKLVFSIPRRGSRVADMSREDCEQIYRARIMLECAAIDIIGEQGITDFSQEEEALAADADYVIPANPTAVDMLDYFSMMSRFHNSLVRCCGNRWVIHYHNQLRSTMARYQVLYLRLPGTRKVSVEEHKAILGLLEGGRHQTAKARLAAHIQGTLDALIRAS
jgi:DNA-binding GntR family transcriptional regulator